MPQEVQRRKFIAHTYNQRHWYFPTHAGNLQSWGIANIAKIAVIAKIVRRAKFRNRQIARFWQLPISNYPYPFLL